MFGFGKKKSHKLALKSGKKKPFGGFAINFDGRQETLEHVFGKKPITPSEMTKRLWKFVKSRRLGSK